MVSCDYHPTLAQAVLCIIKDGCGWWSTCYHVRVATCVCVESLHLLLQSYVTGDFGRVRYRPRSLRMHNAHAYTPLQLRYVRSLSQTWQKVAGYVRAAVWAYSTHPGVVSAPDSILVTHTGQTKGGQSFSTFCLA